MKLSFEEKFDVRKEFYEKLLILKETCIRCWAIEYSDIFPQTINKKIATEEFKRRGSPECRCKKKIKSKGWVR